MPAYLSFFTYLLPLDQPAVLPFKLPVNLRTHLLTSLHNKSTCLLAIYLYNYLTSIYVPVYVCMYLFNLFTLSLILLHNIPSLTNCTPAHLIHFPSIPYTFPPSSTSCLPPSLHSSLFQLSHLCISFPILPSNTFPLLPSLCPLHSVSLTFFIIVFFFHSTFMMFLFSLPSFSLSFTLYLLFLSFSVNFSPSLFPYFPLLPDSHTLSFPLFPFYSVHPSSTFFIFSFPPFLSLLYQLH